MLAEVLQGFRWDCDFRSAQAALEMLVSQPMVGRANALASARNYRALRAAAVTVSANPLIPALYKGFGESRL